MAGLLGLGNIWSLVTEMDLRPLREQAEYRLNVALVGKPGSGRHALASMMRQDPSRSEIILQTPLLVRGLDEADQLPDVDLVILLIDLFAGDDRTERELVRAWLDAGKRVLVFINRSSAEGSPGDSPSAEQDLVPLQTWIDWGKKNVLVGSVEDAKFLQAEFVPAMMRLLPGYHLALARSFPLFRLAVARSLVNDTCATNAAYSLSTGLIEIVPILNIPMNVTDIFILTKNQVFLVYKLGLALGMSTQLQSYVTAFGGILGAGFFWRQAARMLVGLIPGWGIIPKAAVSYAGTYVVGSAVLQWYLTGSHLTREQVRKFYIQAFARGKQLASNPAAKLKRPRSRRSLPSSQKKEPSQALQPPWSAQPCPHCGKSNSPDASFCQYCGKSLADVPGPQAAA